MGFEPLGDVGRDGKPGYLQAWPVERQRIDPEHCALTIGDAGHPRGFGVIPGLGEDATQVTGRLVDCAFGAADDLPEEIRDGQIPFVMLRAKGRPGLRVEAQFMTGLGILQKARSIAQKLADRGAKCVLFGSLADDNGLGDFLNYCGLNPDKPLVAYGRDRGMAAMVEGMRTKGPMVFLSRALTEEALAQLGRKVEEGSVGDAPDPRPVAKAAIDLKVIDEQAEAWNVCAVLRGKDKKLAAEAVVFSAHMDHMGTRLDGQIFRGADDDGSGISSLCEIAEAMKAGGPRKRSIVLLAVAGEEEGLWGSKHYSEHPTWPIENIVADVNIDMIGRNADLSGPDEISITPSYEHRKFSSIAQHAARLAGNFGLSLTIGDKFYERSDHFNFAVKGIPVVFFCDGEHPDYHQVSDTPDRLDYVRMEAIARLLCWTGLEACRQKDRPKELGKQDQW